MARISSLTVLLLFGQIAQLVEHRTENPVFPRLNLGQVMGTNPALTARLSAAVQRACDRPVSIRLYSVASISTKTYAPWSDAYGEWGDL